MPAKSAASGKSRMNGHGVLVSSERACRHFFRVVKDGILLVDAKTGAIREGNPSLLKMLGFSKAGLMKRRVWKIGFLGGPLSSEAAFVRLKREGKRVGFEHLQIRNQRGRILDVDLECAFYHAGDISVVQFNIRDITERIRLETALHEREEQYRKIFDNSQLGIAFISLDLHVLNINQAFSRITGYEEADIGELTLANITHPSDLAADRKLMRAVRSCESADYHVEKRYIGRGGDVIWALTHIAAVCDRKGKPMYYQAIIEDISERKQMEATLAEQNLRDIERERTIQKLKDEFVFIAAHELRNPVTAISWSVEMLRECRKKIDVNAPELSRLVEDLDESSKRLNNLVGELLQVSRLEYGSLQIVPSKFGLTDAVNRAVTSVRKMAEEKQVSIKVVPMPDGFPDAFADRVRRHSSLQCTTRQVLS